MASTSSPLARFDALFTAHQRAVLAYAMRRTSNLADAEDVTAETFTIAWRKLEAIPADPLPWLYAVARRVLANHRRGVGRRERLAAVFKTQDMPTPMRVGEDLDGPAFQALASLSAADQEVLRLVAWEGLKNPQIAEVLGNWTGIPVFKLTEAETTRLLRMEEELHKRIIGQEDAVRAVSKAIRRTRAGLKDPKRPSGSFIFAGPSGVGKTELSKALAEFLFGDEDALIQIDMGEYHDRFTASRLPRCGCARRWATRTPAPSNSCSTATAASTSWR